MPDWTHCLCRISFVVDLQHYLTVLAGQIVIPLLVATMLCVNDDKVATSQIFSTMLFVCGMATLLQALVGSRSVDSTYSLLRRTEILIQL